MKTICVPGLGDIYIELEELVLLESTNHKSQTILRTTTVLQGHDDTKMSLRQTDVSTVHNIKGALFFSLATSKSLPMINDVVTTSIQITHSSATSSGGSINKAKRLAFFENFNWIFPA